MNPAALTPSQVTLVERLVAGDRRALARAMTLAEEAKGGAVLDFLHEKMGRAHVIGITGAPGVGKSTLVAGLARACSAADRTVGIVAVDPSSPFSGGAILGDRIRMQDVFLDPKVFIRSMGSRGALGGLARTTFDMIRLMDAFGKDMVLVETVGVGQGEVAIKEVADTTLVVKMPGLGDGIQVIKAGILEIADIYVMNKSDRPGADLLRSELQNMLHLSPFEEGWTPPIVHTVATRSEGIPELIEKIDEHRKFLETSTRRDERRERRREHELRIILEDERRRRFERQVAAGGRSREVLDEVRSGRMSPHHGAQLLLDEERS